MRGNTFANGNPRRTAAETAPLARTTFADLSYVDQLWDRRGGFHRFQRGKKEALCTAVCLV